MRFAVMIVGWLVCSIAVAGPSKSADRVAVVVALNQPSPAVEAVPNAHEQAATLVERLGQKAGYSDVRALIGSAADASTVLDTVRSAMDGLAPDGVLLFVFLGHGAGGDFGDPALLTHGATMDDPAGTGLNVSELAEALQPASEGQHVLAVVDAVHLGSVDGVALIGPTASGWPSLPTSGMTVITPSVAGLGVGQPGLVPVITRGIVGQADDDGDGRTTLTELFRYTGNELRDTSGSLVDTAGPRTSDRVVGGLPGPLPVRTMRPSRTWSSTSTGLIAGGGVVGAMSVVMYLAKRGQCKQQAGALRCGDGATYRRYQVTQHALGWVGGGLVVAGVGLHLIPSSTGLTIQAGGHF